jgi:hypothetical protein
VASLTAIEEEKNVHAAAEFWAVMRTTHGLQNRAASANEVTPKTEPGTTSRQQAEAFLENQRNPKRRRGSDGDYTEPTTTAALLGDIDTLQDNSTSRPDTKRCIQVGRETYSHMLLHHNQRLLIPLILEQTQEPFWDRGYSQ